MTERSRSRAYWLLPAVVAAGAAVGVGVVIVNTHPNNLAIDCHVPVVDGGLVDGRYPCDSLMLPAPAECAGFLCTGGEPPGCDFDAGLPNAQVRGSRFWENAREVGAVDGFHTEPVVVDAGVRCLTDVRTHVIVLHVDGGVRLDGNAPALKDVIDAAGAGSAFIPSTLGLRPAFAKFGGCRRHVMAGEDPCASSTSFDAGPDPVDSGQ